MSHCLPTALPFWYFNCIAKSLLPQYNNFKASKIKTYVFTMQQMMKPYPKTQITRSRPIKVITIRATQDSFKSFRSSGRIQITPHHSLSYRKYWEELDLSTNDVTSLNVAFVDGQGEELHAVIPKIIENLTSSAENASLTLLRICI